MADTTQPQDIKNTNVTANSPTRSTNGSNANTTETNVTISLVGNPQYFISVPGILKIIEWVFAIVAIACASPPLFSGVHWFLFVVVLCFICTFVWMCIHFFAITEMLKQVPWLLVELAYTGTATILYFIAMIVLFVETTDNRRFLMVRYYASRYDAYIAAACFALFNMFVYGAETAWHARGYLAAKRNGGPA